MGISLNTHRIIATDSQGKLAAYAEHDGDRWAIHVDTDHRMDESLGRDVQGEANRRMRHKDVGTITVPGGILHPGTSSGPTVGLTEQGGLLLPQGVSEADARAALRDVATLVDGWRAAQAEATHRAVQGILSTVAGAGAAKLPMED